MSQISTEHNHDHDLKGPGYARAMEADLRRTQAIDQWGKDARSLMRSLNIPITPSANGCAHLRAIEQTLQGVVVTGKFYCPDCGRVLPSV